MEKNIKELPPRVHCFEGPRVNINDICGRSNECEKVECLWHKERGRVESRLGADNNRTEAMTKIG